MARPLIISDCDEVLLHMMVPFRGWLDAVHAIDFTFGSSFEEAFRHKDSPDPIERSVIWRLLGEFFDTEMTRQTPIDGALEALERLGRHADIVVLTNLEEHRRLARTAQLRGHGLDVPVYCNRGGKGPAVERLIAERKPSMAIFIDDLESNHSSVLEHVPQVWRVHMVGEPELAPFIPTSQDAHCRLDRWAEAEGWIARRIAEAAS